MKRLAFPLISCIGIFGQENFCRSYIPANNTAYTVSFMRITSMFNIRHSMIISGTDFFTCSLFRVGISVARNGSIPQLSEEA